MIKMTFISNFFLVLALASFAITTSFVSFAAILFIKVSPETIPFATLASPNKFKYFYSSQYF